MPESSQNDIAPEALRQSIGSNRESIVLNSGYLTLASMAGLSKLPDLMKAGVELNAEAAVNNGVVAAIAIGLIYMTTETISSRREQIAEARRALQASEASAHERINPA